jgi:hypothetical protein
VPLDALDVVATLVAVCVDELEELPPAPVDVVVEGELQAAKSAKVPRNEARSTESNYQGPGADDPNLSTSIRPVSVLHDRERAPATANGSAASDTSLRGAGRTRLAARSGCATAKRDEDRNLLIKHSFVRVRQGPPR